jgi:transposase-like protein
MTTRPAIFKRRQTEPQLILCAVRWYLRYSLSLRDVDPQPRVINTDLAPIYTSAIPAIKNDGTLRSRCRHRPVQYLNNTIEQARLPGISRRSANDSRI